MIRPWVRRLLGQWPYLVLAGLAVLFALMLVFSRKAPVIASLEPSMAAPGEQITVNGEYFGRTEREGTLNLAGEIPPPSLIKSWSDQKIVFVVPEDASSGLVSVSNSQGTSTGVLFTNTKSIPTVLQQAGAPGHPLVWAVLPAQPLAGQLVTLQGRGFGTTTVGAVVVSLATGGPFLEIDPTECLSWTDNSISFRVPAGAGATSLVQVRTATDVSAPLPLSASGPVSWGDPRTVTVAVHLRASVSSGQAVTLWGPVPDRPSGTTWSLGPATPAPVAGTRPLAFAFGPGVAGDRDVNYQLTLKTWTRRWEGPPSGYVAADTPPSPPGPWTIWKPSAPALKTLTAKWGLDVPDPWLRLQRLQAGLLSTWPSPARPAAASSRTPAQILTSTQIDSAELATVAAALGTQTGLSVRVVAGLWLNNEKRLVPRWWNEVWIAGAGWVSWDAIDGNPGVLDNRHFAFDTGALVPRRLLPGGHLFGQRAPAALASPLGEVTGGDADPGVQWDLSLVEK